MSTNSQHLSFDCVNMGSKDIIPINMRDPFFKDPFFSSTWDEFDRMRQDMMAQSKDFWNKVDEDLGNFDDMVRKQHAEMDRQMAPAMPRLPSWTIPEDVKDKWRPMLMSQKSDSEVIKVKDNPEKFEITLDVSQYKPEELKVSTVNNTLSVEGKHEQVEESNNSGGQSSSSVIKHFSRKWTLPEDCKQEDVVSNLSSDGILMITAPRNPALGHKKQEAIK